MADHFNVGVFLDRVVIAIVAAALIAIITAATLNYRGVCLSGPQLSEEERIARVIQRFLKSSQSFSEEVYVVTEVNGERRKAIKFVPRADDLLRYNTVEAFLSSNPDCCDVVATGRKGNAPGFLTRITGGFSGFVRLRYVARIKTPDGGVRLLPREVRYATSNCGTVWDGI